MAEASKFFSLLTQTSTVRETRDPRLARGYPASEGFRWLSAGWRDLWTNPVPSIIYGLGVLVLSAAFVWTLFAFGRDYILFPALAGFMIIAPFLALGLYEKSRALEEGRRVTFGQMILARARAGAQVFYAGLLLCLLMLLWMRAAVLIYALFFGVTAFPGLDHIAQMLFGTLYGWIMLIVGTAIGGIFAAFAFSISVFSMPMMLERRVDALTAMGESTRLVWNNLPALIGWGAMVLALFIISVLTGLLGMVIIFPLLGHATWHAYRAIALPRRDEGA